MAGVDLGVFRFDYDLTYAALLMHPDGTIYHTYGGRDFTDPVSHLSVASFVRTLKETLREHAAHRPGPATGRRPRTVERLRQRVGRKEPKCYHCHMVHDFETEHRKKERTWKRDLAWIYPDPIEAGLRLERDLQTTVAAVEGPAAAAGLEKGDVLVTFGGRAVLTFGDLQAVLHDASGKATTIAATWRRAGAEHEGTLRLPAGWKEPAPRVFAWRPSKWPMSPKPGFGGRLLGPDEKRALGLVADEFAFRVGYLVTWGPNAYTGRNAARAGLRKGDVVFSVAGKTSFDGMDHFHAWFRLTQRPGTEVPIELVRDGKRHSVTLPVLE